MFNELNNIKNSIKEDQLKREKCQNKENNVASSSSHRRRMVSPKKSPRRKSIMLSSPKNIMKTPVGSPIKDNPSSSPDFAPSAISSKATTVCADSTPMEQNTSVNSSSSSSASFTPYSAYTPLSVKISRIDAQMSGKYGAESDMPTIHESVLEGSKKAKRSINDALDTCNE